MSRRGTLSPVGRETLHDRVYAELRRSLIHGMFDAGDMLRIQDLAATLQTSTMPVREALGRLVSEQALEALAQPLGTRPHHHPRAPRRSRPRPLPDRRPDHGAGLAQSDRATTSRICGS